LAESHLQSLIEARSSDRERVAAGSNDCFCWTVLADDEGSFTLVVADGASAGAVPDGPWVVFGIGGRMAEVPRDQAPVADARLG